MKSATTRHEWCIPVGTVAFKYESPNCGLFVADAAGILLQQVAGQHYFRLERLPSMLLRFTHSCPGTGTRHATLDLTPSKPADSVDMRLAWSPQVMGLSILARVAGAQSLSAEGDASPGRVQVAAGGQVVHIGGPNIEVSSVRMQQGGMVVVEPSAREVWEETLHAIDVLSSGQSMQGFLYEVVRTNMLILMLVTGFEAYAKKRFVELEGEGYKVDTRAVYDAFSKKEDRTDGRFAATETEAAEAQFTPLEVIAKQKVNFQNLGQCKRAFQTAYGLRFSEFAGWEALSTRLKLVMRHRHRVVHVSPMLSTIISPGDELGSNETVFANTAAGNDAHSDFRRFVETLHEASLHLPAAD
ncbi:hypothetical protein ACSFA0_09055 [Variovorax sp. LT1P1]|uniref:hypothetical protein n=1 Tax=Variovorax sp. LT1P1 TaxID=3443730 RepID=UPI003F48C74D